LMKASFQTWNTVCPAYDYTAAFPHEETDLYMVEQLHDWFPFAAAAVDGGALQFSCSGASTCMPLTTCVVGSERFNTELELMLSEESPKVLVGEQRAVALVVFAKWQWAQTIQRSAENTLGIEIVSWPTEQSDPITILVEAVDTTIFDSTWSDHGAFLSDQVTVRGLENGVGLEIKVSYPCTSSGSMGMHTGIGSAADTSIVVTGSENECSFTTTIESDSPYAFAQQNSCPPLTDGEVAAMGVESIDCDHYGGGVCTFTCPELHEASSSTLECANGKLKKNFLKKIFG
jgi:hypothetical protein